MPAAVRSSTAPSEVSIVFDQRRNDVRSASGTPSSSQMTPIGRGKAKASSRSASAGPAAIRSASRPAIASIRGRRAAMARTVKARLTSLRSRVWSGGSVLSMCRLSSWVKATREPDGSGLLSSTRANPSASLASRGSASASRTSSYRVTSQTGMPTGVTARATGSSTRSRAYSAYGSAKKAASSGTTGAVRSIDRGSRHRRGRARCLGPAWRGPWTARSARHYGPRPPPVPRVPTTPGRPRPWRSPNRRPCGGAGQETVPVSESPNAAAPRRRRPRSAGTAAAVVTLTALTSACAAAGAAVAAPAPAPAPAMSTLPPVPPGPAPSLSQEQVDSALSSLDGLVTDAMDRTGVPGVAVAVVYRDQVVYSKGFGVREVGRPEPVDPATVFQLASVSKPLASTVGAGVVGQRVVEWDQPAGRYDPSFALSDPYVTEHATIADLLSHRSGLHTGAGDLLEDLGFDQDYILSHLDQLPLDPFRSSYDYSNFGYTEGPEAPAGGASSSVRDLAQWIRLQLGNGVYDGTQVIDPDALAVTRVPHSVSSPPASPDARAGFYGLGWNVSSDDQGRLQIGHSGAFDLGAATAVLMLPVEQLGIVALTNGH